MKELKSKKLLAAFLAMAMAVSMAACGSSADDEDEDEEEEITTTTVAEEESEADEESLADESSEEETTTITTTTAVETTTTAEEESEAETESAEDSTAEDSTADTETEATYADGTFSNGIYTLTVDESKWEYSESSGTDCNFIYIGETDDTYKSASTFNVVSLVGTIYADIEPETYADTVKETYEAIDGYIISEGESTTFAGQKAYIYNLTYEITEGYTMEMAQIIFSTDDACVIVSYGTMDYVFSDMQSEFDAVFDTFTIV